MFLTAVLTVDGEVANFWQQVVVMEFGKRRDTADATDFCPSPTCYGLATGKPVPD